MYIFCIVLWMLGPFFVSISAESLSIKEEKKVSIYDFDVQAIDSSKVSLKDKKGKVLLIVNVASKCGYTKQYAGLQKLYDTHKDKGFEVLGFPCNQFGGQEPGTEKEIQSFCDLNYKVTFPLFAKVNVNGKDAHPLFNYLKSAQKGVLGTEAIKWNFTKFLVNKKGEVLARYASATTPESIEEEIVKLLKE